ncbi:MAG: hypothetical protein ACRBCK_02825 [Alphaproteobacteria bacterium]
MIHNVFKASLALACLTTTALTSMPAQSKDMDIYFYPKYKWSVKQTSAHEGTTPATCSIMSELNNGYIIEIDGTKNGLKHLNIDFRQDVFDKGLRYEVQYSVPGASNTIVYSNAVDKNKLQGDLTSQSSFAEQLQTASAMDVRIRNTEFRVYLNGLNTALKDYNDCVSPPQAMASATPTEDTEITPVKEEIQHTAKSDMPQQPTLAQDTNLAPPPPLKTSLIDETSKVPSEQDLAQEQLRPSPYDRPRYTEQMAKKMKEESKKYKPEIHETPTENAATHIPAEKIEPEASKTSHAAQKIAATEPSVALEEPKVSSKTVENYKTPEPVYHVSKNKEPIVADFTDVDTETSQKNAAPEVQQNSAAKITSSTENYSSIMPASGEKSDDFVLMRDKISNLEKELSLVMRKNRMLDDELKGALRDSEKEKLSVSSDNWNLELATMKYNEAERQIMRLGRKLQTHKAQCENEKTELENMLFDPRLTNQQQLSKLSSLESELDKAHSDLLRQQRLYEERIRILEGQLAAQ